MRVWLSVLLVMVGWASLMTGCGGGGAASSGKPVVVATIFSYYDAARAIAGDKADVQIILGKGTSPHNYETTTRDKTNVYNAKLYIKNGLDLDDRFDGLLDGSKAKVLEIAKAIDKKLIVHTEETALSDGDKPASGPAGHADHDHDAHDGHHHDHAMGNPHIWLDPRVQMAAAEKIRDALIEMSPADAATFNANAEKYLEQLKKLDADFAEAAKHFKTKEFIGFHSAYDYLAHRYGLEQIASLEEIPGSGLTVGQTAKIVALIKEKKIKYIAVETAFSDQGLTKVKEDTGVETFTLQPLETYDNLSDTYEGLMRANLEALKKALGT